MKTYSEKGVLTSKTYYIDGERGDYLVYYENGQLAIKGTYKDGIQIFYKCWNEEGNKIECE